SRRGASRYQRKAGCRAIATRRGCGAREDAVRADGNGRGSLLASVSVGLIRRERTEVVPTAVREEPCQERRPVESLQPVFIRVEFPRRRRELRSHRVTSVERTVPTRRLDHRQPGLRVRWWTTIAAGASADADVMAFSSQRPGLVSVLRSAETCNR